MRRAIRPLSVLLLATILALVATGCGGGGNGGPWKGSLTSLSKTYLSKGYTFNLYRYGSEVAADAYGQEYVNMAFQIDPEYVSTNPYDASAPSNIRKVSVSDVAVTATPKKGTVGSVAVYGPGTFDLSLAGKHVDIVGSVKRADFEIAPPDATGRRVTLYVVLERIALYDLAKSPAAANGATPTTRQIYEEMGIDRASVALIVSFRLELLTVSGKTLYHEYAIEVPPVGVDVAGDEYHFERLAADVADMEPFLEK